MLFLPPPPHLLLLHLLLLGVALSRGRADAGANAPCLSAPTWIQQSYKIKDGVSSDLTQCQLDALLDKGVKFQPNNNLIGGDGDASLLEDIYLGGDGQGCQSTERCMQDCQALCCIVPTCRYAVVHRDEDTYCPMGEGTCSIYKEDAYYWYCNLYQTGAHKNTDDDTMCYVEASSAATSGTCASVAQAGMQWNASTYQSLLYLGSNCTNTTRRAREVKDKKETKKARRHGRILPGAEEAAAAVAEIEARAAGETTAATSTATAKDRALASGEADIRAAVQASLLGIRGAVLPGVQRAVAAGGGVKGFAAHLGRLAKALSKGSGSGGGTATMGKKGMRRRKS
jgi:hypothetical protein